MRVLGAKAIFHDPAAVARRLVGTGRLAGTGRHRGAAPWPGPVRAALFDRDGTLVHDEPFNDDPARVRPVDGAARALDRLRSAGLRIGLVTNQPGVALGRLRPDRVDAVHARLAELVGPFDVVRFCPHAKGSGCPCRKPAPGLVLSAARALGVPTHQVVVIGDVGSDLGAARAAGARSILVPTPVTRPEEIAAAAVVRPDLDAAADLVLAWAAGSCR